MVLILFVNKNTNQKWINKQRLIMALFYLPNLFSPSLCFPSLFLLCMLLLYACSYCFWWLWSWSISRVTIIHFKIAGIPSRFLSFTCRLLNLQEFQCWKSWGRILPLNRALPRADWELSAVSCVHLMQQCKSSFSLLCAIQWHNIREIQPISLNNINSGE